jgi:voltage-gated potassium channel
MTGLRPQRASWRVRLHEIIFEAETPEGRGFDVALLLLIGLSVVAVVLESVAELRQAYGPLFRRVEWGVTIIFTIEYLLRLLAVRQPLRYAFSFFGLVDFLAIAPTYLSVFVAGAQSLLVIRALRLLRVFRVLKLVQFVGEARLLGNALRASRRKILVFLGTVMTLVVIIGALMYLIEGEASGFTSIPQSIYWTIVTMTTVGYGDIAPLTVAGKILACLVMVTGYGIIAVPTGIVTVELAEAGRKRISTQACPNCGRDGHDSDAFFCRFCGASLEMETHGGRGGADG